MDRTLMEQMVQVMRSFRRTTMPFPQELDLRMGEMMMMNVIARRVLPEGKPANASDLQVEGMTKPAVSQLLNALESKGYVKREINTKDRRKIAVTLTDEGWKTLHQARKCMDEALEKVVTRLGEDDTKKLIVLLLRLRDVVEEVRSEAQLVSSKGDHTLG